MNILLYYQNPYHTVFLESLVEYFIAKGHNVFFLTTCKDGVLHEKMEHLGAKISTHTYPSRTNKTVQFIGQWIFLIRYCRKNKINIVYSHLQFANLIAVLAQYFISAKVFPCRHHSDDVVIRGNKNAMRLDKLVNIFSRKLIVVSNAVKDQLIKIEKIKPEKIIVIPLGYNFNLYDKPDFKKALAIRENMQSELLLIIIGRMTENKRHIIALQVLERLISEKFSVKMIILDEGIEESKLKLFVAEKKLGNNVLFTGFLKNTMDYLEASDLLIHPSISEASSQVVKEAAILNKPSIVCNEVGDFDEYMIHKKNGFLVSKENCLDSMYELVKEYYYKKTELKNMGREINTVVKSKFDINPVGLAYLQLAE